MVNTTTQIAIDLITTYYELTDPFDIQSKIEEELNMEIHINDILKHLKIENYGNKFMSTY